MKTKKPPVCSGYRICSPDGDDFDCDAIHGVECDHCLCNFPKLGGLWHPETGHQWKESSARRLFNIKEKK